jgi:hypothetical protein
MSIEMPFVIRVLPSSPATPDDGSGRSAEPPVDAPVPRSEDGRIAAARGIGYFGTEK